MVRSMASNSWLKKDTIQVAPGITLRNPKIDEILDNEQMYYNAASTLTSVPYQFMVQLDDMGIDFTTISEFEFFQMMFMSYVKQAMANKLLAEAGREAEISPLATDMIFDDLVLVGFDIYVNKDTAKPYLYNPITGIEINELTYSELMKAMRKLNNFEHVKAKPGNETARKYLLEKERRRLKREAKKPYEPYLEKLVVAMVNTPEFKYNYEETFNMRLYMFNQSMTQIQHRISFDKAMIGVSIGFVDTNKMTDKSILSWIKM